MAEFNKIIRRVLLWLAIGLLPIMADRFARAGGELRTPEILTRDHRRDGSAHTGLGACRSAAGDPHEAVDFRSLRVGIFEVQSESHGPGLPGCV